MQSHAVAALIRRILVFPAVALVALMLPVSAASAHDSLTGTTPTEGQTLSNIPEAVELTFTDVPIGLGTEVVVEGPEGTDWAAGEPEIVDNIVTQPISPDAPAGHYTVTWRVVSSDSHPIEGVFEFTANAGGSGASGGTESSGSEPLQSDTAAAGAEDPESGQSESAFPTSFIIVLSALLVAVLIFMAVLARRRLKKRDDLG